MKTFRVTNEFVEKLFNGEIRKDEDEKKFLLTFGIRTFFTSGKFYVEIMPYIKHTDGWVLAKFEQPFVLGANDELLFEVESPFPVKLEAG